MPDPHHWTPDLLELLVATIPRLVRGKQALLDFFGGAGVPESILRPHRIQLAQANSDFKKAIVARQILTAINTLGDPGLGPRRQVLNRVVTFESFSTCYPDDQVEAELGVRKARDMIERKDAFTEIRQERQREVDARRAESRVKSEALAIRDRELEHVKQCFATLFGIEDAQKRGRLFEAALTALFKAHSILVLEPFTIFTEGGVPTEQIDGVITLDGMKYLVEAKWQMDGIDVPAVAQHCYRVVNRPSVGGLFISGTGYKRSAIYEAARALSQCPVILVTLRDLWQVIDAKGDVVKFLVERSIEARFKRNPFVGSPIPD